MDRQFGAMDAIQLSLTECWMKRMQLEQEVAALRSQILEFEAKADAVSRGDSKT